MIARRGWGSCRRHLRDNHLCAIVTSPTPSSPRRIARAFGVDQLLATELEVQGREVYGQALGTPSFREGKVTRLANGWANAARRSRRFPRAGSTAIRRTTAAARARDAPSRWTPTRSCAGKRARAAGRSSVWNEIVPVLVVALVPRASRSRRRSAASTSARGSSPTRSLGRGDEIAREIVWACARPGPWPGSPAAGSSRWRARCFRCSSETACRSTILGVSRGSGGRACGDAARSRRGGLDLAALAGASIAAGAGLRVLPGTSGWNPYRVLLTARARSGFGALVGLMPRSHLVAGTGNALLAARRPSPRRPERRARTLAACAALAFSQSSALDVLILARQGAQNGGSASGFLRST